MSYRERRERRAERLREWADKRDVKARTAEETTRQLADSIPLGQPILVGHHSERRARRDAERIASGMRRTIEHGEKADDFRGRAATIERQLDRSIYTDDDDAPERLRERIAELEAEREQIKAYNASARKGAPDRALLSPRLLGRLDSAERVGMGGKRGAFPAYVLTNLSGNIKRQKDRLAHIESGGWRVLALRYAGDCERCGAEIPAGTVALYSKIAKTVRHNGAECPA